MSLADDLERQAAALQASAAEHQRQVDTLLKQATALREAAAKVRAADDQVNRLTDLNRVGMLDDMATAEERSAAISSGMTAGRARDEAIRALLKDTGLPTITAVAEAIGVTPAMMSGVLKGTKKLGADKQKLLDELKAAAASKRG